MEQHINPEAFFRSGVTWQPGSSGVFYTKGNEMVTKKQYIEYAKECEAKADRLEKQVAELEAEVMTRINERDAMQCFLKEAQKERDDVIDDARKDSAAYRKEFDELEQRYNECHAELIETSRQLQDAKEIRQAAQQDFRDMQDIQNRARLLLRYYLYVELGRAGEREDQRQCSQVQRFVYLMQDVLDGL